jgi:hypothetical protein
MMGIFLNESEIAIFIIEMYYVNVNCKKAIIKIFNVSNQYLLFSLTLTE